MLKHEACQRAEQQSVTEGFNMHFSACGGKERLLANRRTKEDVLERPARLSPSLELHSSGSWNSSLETVSAVNQRQRPVLRGRGTEFPEKSPVSRAVLSARPELCEKDTHGAGDIAAWIKIAVSGPKTCVHRRTRLRQTHKLPLINRHEEIR